MGGDERNGTGRTPPARRAAVFPGHPTYALGGAVSGAIPKTDDSIRLRALLALDYVELYLIAFFERFVPIQLDCRVVDEYIWSVFASDESVALGVVKPLDLTLVLSHSFLPSFSLCFRGSVGNRGESHRIFPKTPK